MNLPGTAQTRSQPGLGGCSSLRHKCGSGEFTASERDKGHSPNQQRCFLVSGRASFLNLRTITTKIVLEEEFKQNRMGTMAGNHSEILSNEPACWLEAVEPGRLQDPPYLPGLAAHPCPPARDPGSAAHTVPICTAAF